MVELKIKRRVRFVNLCIPKVNKEILIYRNSYIYQRVYGTNGYAGSHGRWTWSGNIQMSANDTLQVLVNNMTIYGNQRDYSNFSGFLVG